MNIRPHEEFRKTLFEILKTCTEANKFLRESIETIDLDIKRLTRMIKHDKIIKFVAVWGMVLSIVCTIKGMEMVFFNPPTHFAIAALMFIFSKWSIYKFSMTLHVLDANRKLCKEMLGCQ